MRLTTGYVVLALIWAVSARPQGGQQDAFQGQEERIPPQELDSLIAGISARLMCAGKDEPDCESKAASCLAEYDLLSSGPPDFEKLCKGRNQLLCYTAFSECIDLLAMSPRAGPIITAEVCSVNESPSCLPEVFECIALLAPVPGRGSPCPSADNTTLESSNTSSCSPETLKCVNLLRSNARPQTEWPLDQVTTLTPPQDGPLRELIRLAKTATAVAMCSGEEIPDCRPLVEQCLSLFDLVSPSGATQFDLNNACKGSVDEDCISRFSQCSDVMKTAPATEETVPILLCRQSNVADCENMTSSCLRMLGKESNTDPCANDGGCDSEVAKCVDLFHKGLSALNPNASSSVDMPGVEVESSNPEPPSSTDPLGIIAEIINNLLILQMCAGKEVPECHSRLQECMFGLKIPPPGFGPPVDNETICDDTQSASVCTSKRECLGLFSPLPNSSELLPLEICQGKDIPDCESKAVVCLGEIGYTDLSVVLSDPSLQKESARSQSFPFSAPTNDTSELQGAMENDGSGSHDCLEVISPSQPFAFAQNKAGPERGQPIKTSTEAIVQPMTEITPTAQSTSTSIIETLPEEETPGVEILCPKGGLECHKRAEECLQKLEPDDYFIRELADCNAEVGIRMKNCMKPSMERLLGSINHVGLRTRMLEAFPICFDDNDFPGIRLCEARTCMEVLVS